MNATERFDDGSDDSIASSQVARQAVLKGIGRLEAIHPIEIEVALTSTDRAETFQFSRVWKVPHLVMELPSRRLARTKTSFSDAAIASEDVIIGLPVLQHLGIDSRTLLERNHARLCDPHCVSVPHPSVSKTCGSLGRLMITRHHRLNGRESIDDEHPSKPNLVPALHPDGRRANYCAH